MSGYNCPWCGEKIEDPDFWEEDDRKFYRHEETCPGCGKSFGVDVYLRPEFAVRLPQQMEGCPGCAYWNYGSFSCMYTAATPKYVEWATWWHGPGSGPLANCPMGHDKEAGGRALCDSCIFRVATDEFRCIAKASTRPVEIADGEDPLKRCWGYIAHDDPDAEIPFIKRAVEAAAAQ